MSSKTKVLLTGATGYIGGTLIPLLKDYDVTAIVRTEAQAEKIKALGLTPVIGSIDDSAFLEKLAAETNVVVNTAAAGHAAAATAFIKGLAEAKKAGQPAHYIHMSGSSTFSDDVFGASAGTDIYADDSDIYGWESKDTSYIFRAVDVGVVDDGEKFGVPVYIVSSPTIYGVGTGPGNTNSIQIPMLIRAAIKSGQAQYVGKGASIWSHVALEDVVDLFKRLVDGIVSGKATSGKQGYYYTESGEHTWKELAEHIGDELHKKGLTKAPGATSYPDHPTAANEICGGSEWFLGIGFASNSRIRGNRSRSLLGWNPVHGPEAIWTSLPGDIDEVVRTT